MLKIGLRRDIAFLPEPNVAIEDGAHSHLPLLGGERLNRLLVLSVLRTVFICNCINGLREALHKFCDVIFKDHHTIVIVRVPSLCLDSSVTKYLVRSVASLTSKKYIQLPAWTRSENNAFLLIAVGKSLFSLDFND